MSTRIYSRNQIWEVPRHLADALVPAEYPPMKELGVLLAAFRAERLGVLCITRRYEYITNAGVGSSVREYNAAFHGEFENKEIYPAGLTIVIDQDIIRFIKSRTVRVSPQPTCLTRMKRVIIQIKTKCLSLGS